MALDALVTAFEFYFEDKQKVPLPSEVTGGFVDVPLSVASKVLMLNAFIDSSLTQIELAKGMSVKKQEITRLFDLKHATKIDAVQKAMQVLGKRLELQVI